MCPSVFLTFSFLLHFNSDEETSLGFLEEKIKYLLLRQSNSQNFKMPGNIIRFFLKTSLGICIHIYKVEE
jgi:hypothetical protein